MKQADMVLTRHHAISVEKTAHYYTYGNLTAETNFIWIACHGYGQAADRFLSKFHSLDPTQHFVVAPEGLSRFYWKGVSGLPVASWMTSKDRESEIKDQMKFLSQILELYKTQKAGAKFVFFGFSQGCAAIMRLLDHSRHPFSKIILWGGEIPSDIDYDTWNAFLIDEKIHLIHGDTDEYLTPERRLKFRAFIDSKGPPIALHEYKGGHRIIPKVFDAIVGEILNT